MISSQWDELLTHESLVPSSAYMQEHLPALSESVQDNWCLYFAEQIQKGEPEIRDIA